MKTGVIERAYELARTGAYASNVDIAAQLSREGFDNTQAHLSGPSLRRELSRLGREARAASAQN